MTMALGEFVTYVFLGLCTLDAGFWALLARTSRTSDRWKRRLYASVGILVVLLLILAIDVIRLAIWEITIPQGLTIPIVVFLLGLNTWGGFMILIALTRPRERGDQR